MHKYNKNFFYIYIIFLIFPLNAGYKIAFGSCLDQKLPQPIWSAIEKENINSFIFLGDNVYGDKPDGNIEYLKQAYAIQGKKLPAWLKQKDLMVIWDDHDYGVNDGGSDYYNKKISQEIFLKFWNINLDDKRYSREGIYFSSYKNINGFKVHFIGLDTRFFRSRLKGKRKRYVPNNDENATILGNQQWAWLKKELELKSDIKVIMSSIQILASSHRFEKWSNFPHERNQLLDLLKNKTNAKNILLISGDRHRGGIYKLDNIVEITASSLNKPGSIKAETDPLLIGKTHPNENYGLMEISNNKLIIYLKDINGALLESINISIN